MLNDETLEMVEVNGEPPVDLLTREVRREYDNASWVYARNDEAHNARFCLWDGQSPDGRKHRDATGKEVFPWEGASDKRIRTVDMVINDEVRLIKQSFGRARIQAIPSHDSGRMDYARKVSAMLEHTRRVDMLPFLRREVGIAANWRQTYGLAIMNVWWEQERRLEMLEITRDSFHMAIGPEMEAMSGGQHAWLQLDTADLLRDRLKEPIALAWLIELAPLLDLRSARTALNDLRTIGTTRVPNAYPITNRPRWTALRPFVDVFFPAATDDLQKARWIAHRELVSESELKDGIRTKGYDKAFVEEALKNKGRTMVDATWTQRTDNERRAAYGMNVLEDDTRNMVELFHVFYKTVGPDNTPTVMRTILNVGVKDLAAWHGVHTYSHGHYPYEKMAREEVSRVLLESRGLGELLASDQSDIKGQVDSRSDRASMATMPPVITPSQRGLIVPQIRPGMRAQLRDPKDITWLNPPAYDSANIEVEKSTRSRVNEYCARVGEGSPVPQEVAQLYAQTLVDDVLTETTGMMYQTLGLGMQYWTPEHMDRVAGLPKPESPEEIRSMTDFVQLVFDVRDLNDEALGKKWEMWTKYVQASDRFGIVDGAEALKFIAGSLDPWMASSTLRSPEAAAKSELADEDQALTLISSGIEPEVATQGWNYQLRKDHLMQRVMANPNNRARYASDEIYRAMIDNRLKKFDFQLEQQQNAQIGREGGGQVLDKMQPKGLPVGSA